MWCCWLLLLSGPIAGAKPQPADDVAGPIVKLSDISAIEEEPPGQPSNATSHTIAQVIDQALQKEFKEDTDKADSDVGKTFNETSKKDEASAGLAGAPGARQSLHALPLPRPPLRCQPRVAQAASAADLRNPQTRQLPALPRRPGGAG